MECIMCQEMPAQHVRIEGDNNLPSKCNTVFSRVLKSESDKMPSERRFLSVKIATLSIAEGIMGIILAGLMSVAFDIYRSSYTHFQILSGAGIFFCTLKILSDGLMISGILKENPVVAKFWMKSSLVATVISSFTLAVCCGVIGGGVEIALIIITVNLAILNCVGFWLVFYNCSLLENLDNERIVNNA